MANSAPPKKANGKNRTISNIISITTITTTTTSRMKNRSKSTSLIKITTIMKSKTLSRTIKKKTSKMAKETMKLIVYKKALAQSVETLLRKTNMLLIELIKSDSLSSTLSFACHVRTCAQFRDVSSCSIKTGGSSRKKTSLSKSQLL